MVQSKSDIGQRLARPLLMSIRKSANRSIRRCPARCMIKLERGCTHSEYDIGASQKCRYSPINFYQYESNEQGR